MPVRKGRKESEDNEKIQVVYEFLNRIFTTSCKQNCVLNNKNNQARKIVTTLPHLLMYTKVLVAGVKKRF